jgi:hypothetical protein
VPVRELLALPLLTQARRWKLRYGPDAVAALAQEGDTLRAAFDRLRTDYAQPGGSGGAG